MRRSKQDWLDLFQEFETSDLNQKNFCQTKGINPAYFSLKRTRLLPSSKGSGFVKINPQPSAAMSATLECGQVRIHFSPDTPLRIIADLARELA